MIKKRNLITRAFATSIMLVALSACSSSDDEGDVLADDAANTANGEQISDDDTDAGSDDATTDSGDAGDDQVAAGDDTNAESDDVSDDGVAAGDDTDSESDDATDDQVAANDDTDSESDDVSDDGVAAGDDTNAESDDASEDQEAASANLIATCEAANAAETASADEAPVFAFASTRTADFSAGFYERISIGDTIELSGCSQAIASSDNVADTDGSDLYGIGRFNQDNITRFDVESFDALYQYSVVGEDGVASNPYDIAFVSETKAYIARYGTTQVWIVNPSATSQEDFFQGEIDLSAYDADGAVEMSQAIVAGDRLYVLMQRLQSFSPTLDGYIAVIDTTTDTEIATGQGSDGLNGIQLPMRNGMQMFLNEATNDLVVASTGDAFNPTAELADTLTGGVLLVDTTDFTSEVLIDDDTLGEFVSGAVIASADKGYVLSFSGFGTSFLRAFNPSTGVVDTDPLPEFNGIDITTVAIGPAGNVWVGISDAEANGFDRINPADNAVIGDRVRTELTPTTIVFIAR